MENRKGHSSLNQLQRAGTWATVGTVLAAGAVASGVQPAKAQEKPNILVIFSDDIGMWNISAYHRGMMGGSTPNIDRIANEGALFTDYCAQQSCTAGVSRQIKVDSKWC